MVAMVGDIAWMDGSKFGHVGIFTNANTMLHAQNSGGLHTDGHGVEQSGQIIYQTNQAFRPPWADLSEAEQAAAKARITAVTNRFMRQAVPYGIWRAIRLKLGSSTFGPEAKKRLDKYWARLQKPVPADRSPVEKLVTKLTCVEAAILTYQLAFYESRTVPFFINLDAAHTMPRDMAKWLLANRWTKVSV